MAKQIGILLAPGFEEVEAVTAIDFLRRAEFSVSMLGVGAAQVVGSRGIPIVVDSTVEDFSIIPDAVVIPGGMPGAKNVAASQRSIDLIRSTDRQGGWVCGICAAPAVVLAPNGFLSGRKATCYPGFEKEFGRDITFTTDRVVVDGNIITSRGPGTAAEFAIEIIRRLAGDSVADSIHSGTLQKPEVK